MSIQVVHDVLAADAAVTALVSDRISPLEHKEYTFPAVVLSLISLTPVNDMAAWSGTDNSLVQVDSWGTTYASAAALAQACRSALESAGYAMQPSPADSLDPFINLNGVYRISYQFSIWF